MRPSAALLAICFVSALGCAHRDPSAPAWKARVVRERQQAAPSAQRVSARPKALSGPDAWFHREIAEREARIEALRQQLERADGREDEQAEDVKGRLERELELEEESLDDFREVSTKRYSRDMTAGGALLFAVGSGALFAGLMATVVALYRGALRGDSDADGAAVAALVLVPLGVGGLAVGLPLFRLGNKRVVKPEPTAGLWVGPRELGVRGSF
jgi:biopolymer transport protein ExbB/TolQ